MARSETVQPDRRNEPWTQEENERLRNLARNPKLSYREISELMGRTRLAIMSRFRILHIDRFTKPIPEGTGQELKSL